MTNDPSKTITRAAPASVGSDSIYREGNTIPLPVVEGGNAPPAPDAIRPPDLVKTIGKTTSRVRVHFSETSRETMSDKIKRMLRKEVDQM